MWWLYYNTASSAVREPSVSLPRELRLALLEPPDARSLQSRAQFFGIDPDTAQHRDGTTQLQSDGRLVSFDSDGVLTAILAEPNTGNRSPLSQTDAVAAAERALTEFGLNADADLVLDRVVEICEGGASDEGDGHVEGPFTTGTMVQYRQVVNSLPIITPGGGTVRITVDNDGTVTKVHSSTRVIGELSDLPRSTTPDPAPPGATARDGSAPDPATALDWAFNRQLRNVLLTGPAPISFNTVPNTIEVGYYLQGNQAALVAQRAVEVEFAGGFRKRYWVKAPLLSSQPLVSESSPRTPLNSH